MPQYSEGGIIGLKDDCTLERRQKNQKQGNLDHNCQKIMQSLCEHNLWHSLLSGQERSLQYCHGPQATNVPNVALYSKLLTKKVNSCGSLKVWGQ